MKAAVMHAPGGPDVLRIEQVPIPQPRIGEVLIRVRAAGLNRSEMFTRQGLSPGIVFPRILGIEATGTVESAPGAEFTAGRMVATVMGGLGRQFDGGYAEYTCVPAANVRAVATTLPWETLGALPEMLQTAWGSLYTSLQLKPAERLLIRGGTTSVGLAAAAIAKHAGAFVAATTRNPASSELLRANGVDQVFIDDVAVADQVGEAKFDKVLELVGITTLPDSLKCAARNGRVCLTGMVGNAWAFEHFSPMEIIPKSVGLTVYGGEVADFLTMPFQQLVDDVAAGTLHVQVGRVMRLDEIVAAHRLMETGGAGGKIVILP